MSIRHLACHDRGTPPTHHPTYRSALAAVAGTSLLAAALLTMSRVTTTLLAKAKIAGTSWAVDVRDNRVEVTADRTVSAAEMARLPAVTNRFPARTEVTRTAGVLRPMINGGKAIYVSQYRCSLGFNVRNGSTYYFLTAGHCTNLGSSWYADGAHMKFIGTTAGSSFPGNDYRIIQYAAGVKPPGSVYLYGGKQNITSAAKAYVGERVKASGSTTGVHSGTAKQLDVTVNYAEGTVYGLIKTDVCRGWRQRRLAVRRHHGDRPDLRWKRKLHVGRYDVLPAGDRAAQRLRCQRLLREASLAGSADPERSTHALVTAHRGLER